MAIPNELFAAAERGDLEAVRRCLRAGCDVNAADTRPLIGCGYTPLHYAAGANHVELIRLLIRARAAVDPGDVTGATPLWRACNAGHFDAARELLAVGADPNIRNGEGYSCLGRVSAQHAELADLLRAHGAVI